MTAMLLVLASSLLQDGPVIPRREEARGAFLATPGGIYRHYCAHCHDEEGRGRWPKALAPAPPALDRTRLDEPALREFITGGSAASGRSSLCPPWGRTIPREELNRLARHLAAASGRGPRAEARDPDPPSRTVGGPFPWVPAAVVAMELLLLGGVLLRRKKEAHDAVPKDPPLRG